MKIQPTGPIVDLETSNMAHFPGNYLGQVFQALTIGLGDLKEEARALIMQKNRVRETPKFIFACKFKLLS